MGMHPAGRRILVIDDDPVDREILRQHLQFSAGGALELRTAENARTGLELIRNWKPDCILLDLNLPDMRSADSLLSVLYESGPVPVVVITAHGSEEIAAEAMRNGAADYLIKGNLNGAALGHSLEKVFERQALRRKVEEQRRHIEERNRELEAGIAREQAARRAAEESEARYRSLAEAIPQVVWTARHPGGEFDYLNERWNRTTGAPAASGHGHRWMEWVHPDDVERVAERWRLCRGKKSQFEAECRLRCADGSFRWNLIRAAPVVRDAETLRWLGTFTDVEEQKRAEQLLGQRQKLESIGLLAGGVAHDFNNLLVGIIGAISYSLEVVSPTDGVRPMLETALNAGERAAHLIRQMLAYAGKGRFVLEPVDVSDVVQKTWELVRPSIPSSIQVQFITRSGLPTVDSDASQIEQIVMNLLINSAEAIPSDRPGRIVVRTDLERVHEPIPNIASDLEPGEYVLIEVRDDGCGMDEGTRARIFDPFFTTKFTGRGLGLAAVQGIVRNHNGAILVESTPGQGSSFRILLPAGRQPQHQDEAARVEAPPQPQRNGRVLVVDDEAVVRQVAKISLERSGLEVCLAETGYEAIEMMRSTPGRFSLIVLDLSMPGMSGIETLARIRQMDESTPVLLASGYSELEMKRQSAGLTVSGFLQKPFTSTTLREAVTQFLQTAHLDRGAGRV